MCPHRRYSVCQKAGPRKAARSREKGKSKILTSTPMRNEIAEDKETKRKKYAPKVKKILFKKKYQSGVSTRSSDEESAIAFDASDEDMMAESDGSIIEGDFVVVKILRK
jgi:hypothetical protein